MKKIYRVIYQEILPPTFIALAVLTFVVFTREFGRLAELLIRKNADALIVIEVIISLLPNILIYTVPISFLVGTLIGFSRLSSESEVVAMRAGGISVYQILVPVTKVSLVVTLLTLALTLFLLPAGNWNLRKLRQELGVRPVQSQLKPRVFNEEIPGKLLYVDDIDLTSGHWKGVFLNDVQNDGSKRLILAGKGQVIFSPDNRRMQISLEEGSSYQYHNDHADKYSLSSFGTLGVSVDLPQSAPLHQQSKRRPDKHLSQLLLEIRQAPAEVAHGSLVELHRRLALPLAALVFGVLGVTLGMRSHRGGRGYGTIVSMVIALSYYVLFATGSSLAAQGVLNLAVGVWGANLLLAALAWLSLPRHRRGKLLSGLISRLLLWGRASLSLGPGRRPRSERTRQWMGIGSRWVWKLSAIRPRFTQVIDVYLVRLFSINLLATLSVSVALFYLFTFFELIDEIFDNHVAFWTLTDYFLHLLPHVLMLLIPISVLIAVLVTFGILEKTFQLVAFKASGISLYRIVLPILAIAMALSGAMFVMQEYVLPFANQRQDNLRSLIIRGQPVQTFYQAGRNWIFGQDNRLYNYNHYNPERNVFAELSLFEIGIQDNRLTRHTFAQRAEWDRNSQSWRLLNGWSRYLSSDEATHAPFDTHELAVEETPDFFVREVQESSKMTYLELDQYIRELQLGGFEVDHLRTDLQAKIAFPLVSLIMVILGVPFAISIGKKGALYGVALGVLLGIVYWGAFGIFGVLGSNGLLAPVLAAWGPNLLFGAGSLLLLMIAQT